MRFIFLLVVGFFTVLGSIAPAHSNLIDEVYLLTDRKQYGAALDKLNTFLKTNPDDAQARFLKGLVLTERGQRDQAIVIFRDLSKDYPDLPEPYNNLAVLYAEKGMYDKARTALQKAIETHPTYATAHENMGDIYAKMASRSYRKALSLNSANDEIKTKIGHIKKVFVSHITPPKELKERKSNNKKVVKKKSAKKPRPTKSARQKNTDIVEVKNAVDSWAKAWTSLNINNYLNSYSKKFRVPPKFPNYNAWVQNRKRVIGKAKTIRVTYEGLSVILLDKNLARAEFKQNYWSPNYKDQVNKTLTLAREGKKWKIVWERSEG
jgi:tetratricopeptide (TPR) repeat protein